MSTYIDLHVLQTVPPSNLNRDDTGSPKTAIYGGVRRARVSSQAWKRAVRDDFKKTLPADQLGERTLIVAERIATEVAELKPELADRALDLATKALQATGIKIKKEKAKLSGGDEVERSETGALLFASLPQIKAVANLIAANPEATPSKKDAQQALKAGVTIDVALFGRMIADAPELNIDACAQVAHAISVHAVDNEFDYFTAVDDNAPKENAGAEMIGTVEFNSSTLYRYATVNADELAAVLGSADAAAAAVVAFTRAFATSMPTGKQNTFANRTLPDLVLLTIRDDQPVNLVGAFEAPVASPDGRVKAATTALLARADQLQDAFGTTPVATAAVAIGDATVALGAAGIQTGTLQALLDLAHDSVAERCKVE